MEAHPTISTRRRGHRMISLGTMYIQTARDADVVPLWLNCTVILARLFVLSSCWYLELLHFVGVVDRMQDASAAAIATIWSNVPW